MNERSAERKVSSVAVAVRKFSTVKQQKVQSTDAIQREVLGLAFPLSLSLSLLLSSNKIMSFGFLIGHHDVRFENAFVIAQFESHCALQHPQQLSAI